MFTETLLKDWCFWCSLVKVWPWISYEGRRLKLAFSTITWFLILKYQGIVHTSQKEDAFLLHLLCLLPITWITSVARPLQDFPWLFITMCKYIQTIWYSLSNQQAKFATHFFELTIYKNYSNPFAEILKLFSASLVSVWSSFEDQYKTSPVQTL